MAAGMALAWPSVKFLLLDAVWTGSSRDACLPEIVGREVGACWPFVAAKFAQFMVGFYPESEQWRVALTYALGMLTFGEAMPAWALAAIWGLHPLLTESVTNVVGRADLLAAFGVLAGLLCHAQAASAPGRRRSAWLVALALCQAIGLFSK